MILVIGKTRNCQVPISPLLGKWILFTEHQLSDETYSQHQSSNHENDQEGKSDQHCGTGGSLILHVGILHRMGQVPRSPLTGMWVFGLGYTIRSPARLKRRFLALARHRIQRGHSVFAGITSVRHRSCSKSGHTIRTLCIFADSFATRSRVKQRSK